MGNRACKLKFVLKLTIDWEIYRVVIHARIDHRLGWPLISRLDRYGTSGSKLMIDCQMTLRQPDYCTYREVKVLVCSWNIDSAKPSDLSGSEANTTALEQILTSVDRPDIIVFGFQEVIPLTNKKLTASE